MQVLRSIQDRGLARRSAFVAAGGLTVALVMAPAALADEPDYPPDDEGDGGTTISETVTPPTGKTRDVTFGGTVPQGGVTTTGDPGVLPGTGADVAAIVAFGAGAVALGTGALVVARRRQLG